MTQATVNGIQLQFGDTAADGGPDSGADEVVLLVHGAFSAGAMLAPVADALRARDRVITPDLRGWGGSAHVDFVQPEQWRDDLIALMDHLGVRRFHVGGTSLGARVAARLAFDFPDRVVSLVSDWTLLRADAAADTALNTAIAGFDAARREQMRRLHGDDWEQVAAAYYAYRATDEFQDFFDVRAMTSQLRCPVFITRGDALDVLHPLAHTIELHTSEVRSALWVCPDCPGSAMMTHPAEFARQYWQYRAATA